MRVLIALGGNAMTGPDGAPRPDAQTSAVGVAMRPHRRRRRRRRRGRPHPRQRPAGGQPAGQERAGRARRAAGAAGLVRRADPGDHRLHPRRRAGRRAADARARTAPSAALVTRTLVDGDDPGFREPDQAGRPLPPAGGGATADRRTARCGRTAARRAGAGSSPRPSRSRSLDVGPRSPRWSRPASSSSRRRRRHPRGARAGRDACAASRPSSTRTSPPRCSPASWTPTSWSSPPTSPNVMVDFGTPAARRSAG